MDEKTLTELTKLLSIKYWFGGRAYYPWAHPRNKVQDCLAITLDGCITHKFKVCKNGKLRLMWINESGGFIHLGLKPLQTVTVDELRNRIALGKDKYATPVMQMTSPIPVKVDLKKWNYLQRAKAQAMKAKRRTTA